MRNENAFSKALRAKLLSMNMPRQKLAHLTGLSPATIAAILGGRRPTAQTAHHIAEVLGCTVIELGYYAHLDTPEEVAFLQKTASELSVFHSQPVRETVADFMAEAEAIAGRIAIRELNRIKRLPNA